MSDKSNKIAGSKDSAPKKDTLLLTYEQIIELENESERIRFISEEKKNLSKLDNKIISTCRHHIKPFTKKFSRALGEIDNEHFATDRNGNLVKDQNGFTYTPSSWKEREKDRFILLDKKVELKTNLIDPEVIAWICEFTCQDIPEEVTQALDALKQTTK